MHRSRNLFLALVAGLVFVGATVATPGVALADKLEFTVVEYRLTQARDLFEKKVIGETEIRVPVMELELRGTKKKSNTEVRWTVKDAEPYLKLLMSCANGRIRATVETDFDDDDTSIKDKGPLEELNCRVILR